MLNNNQKDLETTFQDDWKVYLSGLINRRIIHYLDEYFQDFGVKPSIAVILSITEEELLGESWLSVVSCYELLKFQQQLKNDLD